MATSIWRTLPGFSAASRNNVSPNEPSCRAGTLSAPGGIGSRRVHNPSANNYSACRRVSLAISLLPAGH
jgi:hypothetical protein